MALGYPNFPDHMKLKSITARKTAFLLCLAEFIYWIGNTTYYSYLVMYLKTRHLSNAQSGWVLSISALLLLLVLPFWGLVCDRLRSVRTVLLIMCACSALILAGIPLLQSPLLTSITVCFLAVFESGFVSVFDGFVVQSIQDVSGMAFGKIRLWGAVGSGIALFISNFYLNRPYVIFWIYGGALLIVFIILLQFSTKPHTAAPRSKLQPYALLQIAPYVAFVLFLCVLFIPFRFTQSFLVAIMETAGGNASHLRIALLTGCISEGIFYVLSAKWVKRLSSLHLVLVSGVFFILRQLLFLIASTPSQVILANLTLGPSFGLVTAAAVQYIFELAPSHLKSSAQAAGNAIIYGVSGIISNVSGGVLLDAAGAKLVLMLGCLVSLISGMIYLLFLLRKNILHKR